MFFICGLPSSGLEWIANYLTYGETFCLHAGLKDCIRGVTQLEEFMPHGGAIIGNADPLNALMQNKLMGNYPNSKWVIIGRPCSEVEAELNIPGLGIMQAKLEELRAKVNPMVVPFETIKTSIQDIARFVNPAWEYSKERHNLLIQMDFTVSPDTKGQDISAMIEPVTLSNTCKEYLALSREMCAPDPFAYIWLEQIITAALVWDHYIDDDPKNKEMFDSAMYSLTTEWPLNPFVRRNAEALIPALAASISAWKSSDNGQRHLAYNAYAEMAAVIAFVIGGNARVNAFMPRIRELVNKMRLEDDARDGGS